MIEIEISAAKRASDAKKPRRELEIELSGEPDDDEEWELEAMDEALPPAPIPEPTRSDYRPRLALDRGSMRTKDANGFMHVVDCRISKANICPYLGKEIPDSETLGLDDSTVYRLYRDADALAAAAPTFERIPLMIHHIGVTANSPQKDLCIGTVSNVRWQAPYLVADLTVWDAKGIEAIESEEQQELSPGYQYKPVMNSGVLDGESYDGKMTEIKANHLAIVDTGRTGPDVVVNDRAPLLQ
jgi:uncharacterized protein